MNKYTHQQDVMLRKEKAGEEAQKSYNRVDKVDYEIVNNDIVILSGSFINQSVRELWFVGPSERDYIVNKLWSTGDEKVIRIINSLTCD